MTAVFAVLCLATMCWGALGQTTAMDMMMMSPTSSMDMPMPVSSSAVPAPSNVPTEADFGPVGTSLMFNDVVSARSADQLNDVYNASAGANGMSRFNNTLSSNIRRNYYFNVRLCMCTGGWGVCVHVYACNVQVYM